MILLDTHVAVWLAAGEISRLSETALRAIEEASTVALSPITLLEVAYLVEAKRLTSEAAFVIHALTAGA
ncbi:MAG: PIN domain-containing protein, partial [Acidimicrobiia bacterium]